MCLEIKQNTQLKIAQKDIECYKTVIYKDGCLLSLWRDFCYAREDKFPTQEKYTEGWFVESCRDFVHTGFHTFQNMKRAMHDLEFTENIRFVYMRCVIPAGAKYYEGSDRDYCSDSLVVTGWKDRNMSRWVNWPPSLHPAFGDTEIAERVRKKMEEESHVS